MSDHVHSDECTPDTCFREKMRYIKRSGNLAVRYGSGNSPASPKWSSQEVFHNSTIAEEQRKMVAMNKAAGNDLTKKSSRVELI